MSDPRIYSTFYNMQYIRSLITMLIKEKPGKKEKKKKKTLYII